MELNSLILMKIINKCRGVNMATTWGSNGFYICKGNCMYYGERIPNPPRFNTDSINVSTINNKIYLNGYEYFPKQRRWKMTFSSIWHYLF